MQRDPWHNDYPLDAAQVAQIIAADLTQIVVSQVEAFGDGWDFSTFLVNDAWVFRFPKRRQSVRQFAREYKQLDAIARRLGNDSIAIPRYQFYVREPAVSALPYAGYPVLRGEALVDCPFGSIDSAGIGRQLGGFLQRLQGAAPSRPPRIYRDSFPSDLIDFRRELDAVSIALPGPIAIACAHLLESRPPPDEGPPLFQHGDLGAEHILVERGSGRITAIIDWGDAGWGNSVADFVGLWAWGGDAAVRAALPTWGRALSREDWRRLRLWGAAYAIGSAYFGYKDGRDPLHGTALRWLERMHAAGQLADPETPDV